jgi:hypothetical protein
MLGFAISTVDPLYSATRNRYFVTGSQVHGLWGWEVDRTGGGFCFVVVCCISGAEPEGFTAIVR